MHSTEIFAWIFLNCALAAFCMDRILQTSPARSVRIRQFAGWLCLILTTTLLCLWLTSQPLYSLWFCMVCLSCLGIALLSFLYKEQIMMWISTGLVFVIFHQLGTLLMRMTAWTFFGQDVGDLPAGWRVFALGLYTIILLGLEFSMARFRMEKLSLGKQYYVRTETETIVGIFYLLFLCACVLLLGTPLDDWCWQALGQAAPLVIVYFIFSVLYTRREQKKELEEQQHLEGLIARQRQEAYLARERQFELSAIRHDYRNIFLTAEQMLAEERTEETRQLLENYRSRLEQSLHTRPAEAEALRSADKFICTKPAAEEACTVTQPEQSYGNQEAVRETEPAYEPLQAEREGMPC